MALGVGLGVGFGVALGVGLGVGLGVALGVGEGVGGGGFETDNATHSLRMIDEPSIWVANRNWWSPLESAVG